MKILLTTMALLFASSGASAADAVITPDKFPKSNTPEARIFRGSIVFRNYCVLCHGVDADGKGRAAKLYNPKPANLVLSDKNDQYLEMIIRQGGGAIARSEFMPPWGNELTREQITDVVGFLRSIRQESVAARKD